MAGSHWSGGDVSGEDDVSRENLYADDVDIEEDLLVGNDFNHGEARAGGHVGGEGASLGGDVSEDDAHALRGGILKVH